MLCITHCIAQRDGASVLMLPQQLLHQSEALALHALILVSTQPAANQQEATRLLSVAKSVLLDALKSVAAHALPELLPFLLHLHCLHFLQQHSASNTSNLADTTDSTQREWNVSSATLPQDIHLWNKLLRIHNAVTQGNANGSMVFSAYHVKHV